MATATKQHSDFWLDRDLFLDDDDIAPVKNGTDIARIMRLATVRRAVGNFVSILSGKNVPVIFSSGKDSYTDGQQVVISAEEDPTKFDPMVGLALHEGSHILLSDFRFLKAIRYTHDNIAHAKRPEYWVPPRTNGFTANDNVLNSIFPAELITILTPWPWQLTYDRQNYQQLLKVIDDICFLMNMLEDRRIDLYVYKNAVGYRPYYDALYNKYFFTSEIGKNLRFNPEWRELTVDNYLKHLLFSIHPNADHDALPGLRALIKLVDLPNIDRVAHIPMAPNGTFQYEQNKAIFETKIPEFNETPVLWQEACNLYLHILRIVGKAKLQQQGKNTQPQPSIPPMEQSASHLDHLPNMDMMPSAADDLSPRPVQKDTKGKGKTRQEVDGKFNNSKAQKELETIKKVMNGKLPKKKLKKAEREAVDALESANAQMVEFDGNGIPKGKCMVTRKVSDAMLEQDWFIFGRRWGISESYTAAIRAGKRMGQILVHRLQVRNDPLMTKQNRLPQGSLDRRMLAQLGMDITSVFQKSRVDQHRPAMLHLTIDASGSMSGKKWEKVLTVATAIAYASTKLRNVDCVISIRGGDNVPMVCILFDSRKDQFATFNRILQKISPAGSTPEGLCFAATMDLILENTTTHDVYFINFSDGEPAFAYVPIGDKYCCSYGGEVAAKHTSTLMRVMQDAGVKIMSYFIDDDRYSNPYNSAKRLFKMMYKDNASFVNVQNAGEVIFTLNKLLIKRGT